MTADMARLRRELGNVDRTRLACTSTRCKSSAVQRAEQASANGITIDLDRPANVPAVWEDHVKLMFELQVLALQTDMTRVITFQLARETSTRTYLHIGVPEPHHPVSHHTNDPEKLAKLAKINAHHVSLFAHLVQRLKETPDGDGTLLDHSMYLLGSGWATWTSTTTRTADCRGRRRRRLAARRVHQRRGADAARQSPPDAARQGRRPAGEVRRQHGQGGEILEPLNV